MGEDLNKQQPTILVCEVELEQVAEGRWSMPAVEVERVIDVLTKLIDAEQGRRARATQSERCEPDVGNRAPIHEVARAAGKRRATKVVVRKQKPDCKRKRVQKKT
eukprot:m.119514 g.119514  ORF g.119514 m.119514 type:complete len:105 (+) comp16475_c0_seq1:219-533(+)